jgi:hypothetical protein
MEVTVKTKLGRCPFCGERFVVDEFSLIYLECMGKWFFGHYCCDDDEGNHRARVSVSGKTKMEVIKRLTPHNRKDV